MLATEYFARGVAPEKLPQRPPVAAWFSRPAETMTLPLRRFAEAEAEREWSRLRGAARSMRRRALLARWGWLGLAYLGGCATGLLLRIIEAQ